MKIKRIEIQNYKSIRQIDLNTSDKINVFIGGNSVGKTNIFDAITWPLGPVYPSFNSTTDQDHYLGNPDNKIRIALHFDNGQKLELAEEWKSYRGDLKCGLNLNNNFISNEDRQFYTSAYLGIDRQILDYLPSNRWSLIGRILLDINKQFQEEEIIDNTTGETNAKTEIFKKELQQIRDNLLFSVKDQNGREIMKEFISILQQESAKQLNRSENEFSVDLNLYDPWNFYRTLQLTVKEPDTNLQFQASSLGMGVQASISIAILKAYSKLQLRNNSPIFIEEPELFLHPQAQRNFYSILEELSNNGTQIFITTHSPDFLNVGRFNEIFIVRKNSEKGTYISYGDPTKFIVDLKARKDITSSNEELMLQYKNAYEFTGDTQKANEAFFGRKIILVEGESEALVLPYLFQLKNFDHIREGITIVRCGGKSELDRFYRLYSEFGIPCFIIFDGDNHLISQKEKEDNEKKNRAIFKLFDSNLSYPDGSIQDRYLGFKDEFEKELGFQTSSKGLKLYKQVREKISSPDQVPSWVDQVIKMINILPETCESVLKSKS